MKLWLIFICIFFSKVVIAHTASLRKCTTVTTSFRFGVIVWAKCGFVQKVTDPGSDWVSFFAVSEAEQIKRILFDYSTFHQANFPKYPQSSI